MHRDNFSTDTTAEVAQARAPMFSRKEEARALFEIASEIRDRACANWHQERGDRAFLFGVSDRAGCLIGLVASINART